ncbi:MAG: hypothetical protein JJT82_02890 [Legionellaceae bacterium]|nr:hypothetical protein [Legionellaceae bacterium]
MKLKTLLVCTALALSSLAFATGSRHMHQSPVDSNNTESAVQKKMMLPGYCQIEVINRSFEPVNVSGRFIDGDWLDPFTIYPYEYPHYISLYYYGCQPGMYLTISNVNGHLIYDRYTAVYQVVTVQASVGQQPSRVKLEPKAK